MISVTISKPLEQEITNSIVDAIYLYGSRAKGTAHKNSDWDMAVLFSHYETDLSARLLRPQQLEATLERELKLVQAVHRKRHSAGMLLQTRKFQLMRTHKIQLYL